MKNKILKALLCTAVCAALLCVCAFAAETYYPDENGAYTVEYAAGTQGQYYAMLIVEGTFTETDTPTISSDTIIYIDQQTADSAGKASFASFKPMRAVEGTIYIGGSDLNSAVLFGYISTEAAKNVVSGTVTSDSALESTVTLTSTTDSSSVYTVTTSSGVYTVSVPSDTYKFTVTKKNHLSYTQNALEVSADMTKDVTLKGGDINSDNAVNFDDFTEIIMNYATYNDTVDVNGDGLVNFDDFTTVPGSLVFEHGKETCPGYTGKRSGQLVIAEHSLYVQVFNADGLVIAHQHG